MSTHSYKESREQIIENENDSLPTIDQSIRELTERDIETSNSHIASSGRESLSRRHRNHHNVCNCINVLPSNEESAKRERPLFVSRVHSLQENYQHVCGILQETLTTTGDYASIEKLAIPDASPNHSEGTRNTKTDFKTLLKMFLERSSIYALNQIGNSASTRRKVFWAFIMIVGLLGSFIQIQQFLSSYFSYPVVVNIDSNSQLNLQFPAVTLCNMNNIQKKFLPCLKERLRYHECNTSAFTEDYDLHLQYEDDLDSEGCRESLERVSESRIEQFLWRNLITLQSEEDQIAYGHQLSYFIHSCSFNGEKCGHGDFYHFVNPEYGNCFTFNTAFHNKTILTTSFVGPNGGLELELDIEVEKYTYYTRAIGARVQVHDPADLPDVTQRGVNVSPGFETSITLKRYKMQRLQAPYKDECKKYKVGDSMRFCYDRCTKKSVYNQCNCSVDSNSCDERRCDFSKLSDLCCIFTINDVDDECQCPLSCEDTDYLINIFNAVWPSMPYHDANPVNDTETGEPMHLWGVRETRLKVKVYYDTLETTTYRQSGKYQNAELFSQIGGQMGLWLGLSLIALFECIENIFILWQYRAKQKLQNTR